MRFILVSLFAAIACTSLSAAQRPSPSWYVDESIENRKQCERTKALTTNGPIYIDTAKNNKAAGDSQKICIYFPPARITIPDKKNPGTNKTVNLGGWRHDEGKLSHCANQCCEWDPPVSKIGKKPAPPTWFETSERDGCDAVPEEAIAGPLLIRGIEWEPKAICIQNKEGEYEKKLGHLRNCGFKCCTFTPPQPPPRGPPPPPPPPPSREQLPPRRDYDFFPVPEVVEIVQEVELEE
jgi:hypothetical protein